ncbi:MAG: hypothetical protein ACLS8T_34165 [Anaerobutyricum sp.]
MSTLPATFIDHSVEFVPLFGVGAGDTVICKYARQFPSDFEYIL